MTPTAGTATMKGSIGNTTEIMTIMKSTAINADRNAAQGDGNLCPGAGKRERLRTGYRSLFFVGERVNWSWGNLSLKKCASRFLLSTKAGQGVATPCREAWKAALRIAGCPILQTRESRAPEWRGLAETHDAAVTAGQSLS